jgi:hypothetical protein
MREGLVLCTETVACYRNMVIAETWGIRNERLPA